jgi:hypothetical protein
LKEVAMESSQHMKISINFTFRSHERYSQVFRLFANNSGIDARRTRMKNEKSNYEK